MPRSAPGLCWRFSDVTVPMTRARDEARGRRASSSRGQANEGAARHRAGCAQSRTSSRGDETRGRGRGGALRWLREGRGVSASMATATQGGHILMPAAPAARALEFGSGDNRSVGVDHLKQATGLASFSAIGALAR